MDIEQILKSCKVVAVVGLSANKNRPSYDVAAYLKEHGYRVIPVNPKEDAILGERCYPSLMSFDEKVDIVDIFRRSEDVAGVVDEAISKGAGVVWMQEGVEDEASAARARNAGLEVVMDKCIKKEHQRLVGESPLPYGVCEVHFDDES
jgi:predicted CoA-binding protein